MIWMQRTSRCLASLVMLVSAAGELSAGDLYVAPGGTGNGTAGAPFGRVQQALDVAQPGDTIILRPGTYNEPARSVRSGGAGQPITVEAEQPGSAILTTSSATVVRIDHADIVVRDLVIDGQYGPFDTVIVGDGGHRFLMQATEVRRSSRDCIDIRAPQQVTIFQSFIHHCLNAAGGRTDAHGVVAGAVGDLTIRDTSIYSFSGDAIQVDPGRAAPGWSLLTVEDCQLWLEPLPGPENGFAAGTVPGENAIDTKAAGGLPRATLVVRDTEAWGFGGGLISNMAAFNVKENVTALLDRVTVHHSEIAFRVRGPGANGGAHVQIQNAVVHDVDVGVRYEDDIEQLRVWNATFGASVTRAFLAASSGANGLDVRNVLFLGGSKPAEASSASNLVVASTAFVNPAGRDFRLVAGAESIDRGVAIGEITVDRDGTPRPQQRAYDVGAFEWCSGGCGPPPTAPSAPRNVRVVVP